MMVLIKIFREIFIEIYVSFLEMIKDLDIFMEYEIKYQVQ